MNTTPIFQFENMPNGAQNMPLKDELDKDEAIHFGLFQCKGCGLAQLDTEPVSYYKDSTRAGERSKVLIALRQKQYAHLVELFGLEDGFKLLEVGAGKGGFLKTLKEMYGDRVTELGVENNAEFVKTAVENEGVRVIQGFLDDADAEIPGAPFDVFTSFAYPARLSDPNSMLQCVYNNLTDTGVGLIMVPSLEHLFVNRGIYDICNDHIAYYDQKTLRFLVEKNGFEVVEQGEEEGVYIYAYVKKKQILNTDKMQEDIDYFNDKICEFASQSTQNGKKLAVWCAGHFAFTVIAMAGLQHYVDYIIDNAEFKQGRYSPASHIPIVGKEILRKDNSIETILILGSMYITEIKEDIKNTVDRPVNIAWVQNGQIYSTPFS